MNILDLPTEVLEKIISFVPDQLTVGQINRRFYQISCRVSSFKIKVGLGCDNKTLSIVDLDEDESLYRSIMNSDRKITQIVFDHPFHGVIFGNLLEKFKESVLDLTLRHCWMMWLTDFRMLSQLSNLQSLSLYSLRCSVVNVPRDFLINLTNLHTISFCKCVPIVFEIFNHLPDNVLRKVSVWQLREDLDVVLFPNQQNITKIEWNTSRRYAIDTHKPKLTSLHLESTFPEPYAAFASLKSLKLSEKCVQEEIRIICTLHHLEDFHLKYDRFLNLSSLAKLRNLRKIEIIDYTETFQSLLTFKSFNFISLSIYADKLHVLDEPEVAHTICLNCPNIQKLDFSIEMGSTSFNGFLKGLTKLEKFHTYFSDDYTFEHGLNPVNLRELSLIGEVNVAQFEPLFKSCVNLDRFLTCGEVDANTLRVLLTARPNMRELCFGEIYIIDEDFFNVFEALGQNIELMHCEEDYVLLTEEKLKELLNTIEEKVPNSAFLKAVLAGKRSSVQAVLADFSD